MSQKEKEKIQTMFGWLFKPWTTANDGGWCKLTSEAPVNGGRNYNGPKVAKFLVG